MPAPTLGRAAHSSAAHWAALPSPPKPDLPQVTAPPSQSTHQMPSAMFECAACPSTALGSAVITATSRSQQMHRQHCRKCAHGNWMRCTVTCCLWTALLSPPLSAFAQVTTDPPPRSVTNAQPDVGMCCSSSAVSGRCCYLRRRLGSLALNPQQIQGQIMQQMREQLLGCTTNS